MHPTESKLLTLPSCKMNSERLALPFRYAISFPIEFVMFIFVVQYYCWDSLVFSFVSYYLSYTCFRATENTKLYQAVKLNHSIYSVVHGAREKNISSVTAVCRISHYATSVERSVA